MGESRYKIYDASAGSGKTYTLVRSYLKRILQAPGQRAFQNILAITFTNKAVNELKTRILQRLADFSSDRIPDGAVSLFQELQEDLNIDEATIKQRSSRALKEILHNYAFFDISTIDKFTHKVIRTFARDLKLSYNFDVLLDTGALLDEGVTQLISKAGENPELSRVLIEFALEKADDEKSWDIAIDLNKIGKLIFTENHYEQLGELKDKSLKDFQALKQILRKEHSRLLSLAKKKAERALTIISETGLPDEAFPYKTLPNHFRKISSGEWNTQLYDNKLGENLAAGIIVKTDFEPPSEILARELSDLYVEIKSRFYEYQFYQNAYTNLVPLTLLNEIKKEVDRLLLEKNQLPIARFNAVISEEIREQPSPFIYERLGEYYRHYIIDEFQDTSAMQWENLTPLINDALSRQWDEGEKGSLTLVGDAKQAIYRWRGGEPDQFIGLSAEVTNPFVIGPDVDHLEQNYRSRKDIIEFNNAFFKHSAGFLHESKYRYLFEEKLHQNPNEKVGGLVSIEFLDLADEDEKDEVYAASVLTIVENSKQAGYPYKDLCVLVRKNKEGQAVARYLAEREIPVISSESLLLKNNPAVAFLVNLLNLWTDPSNLDTQFRILSFLKGKEVSHTYIKEHLGKVPQFLNSQYDFNLNSLVQTSVYDGLELAIKQFDLGTTPSAYLIHFMEEVLIVGRQQDTSVNSFLDHWELAKDSLSIKAPDNLDAVTVMTIHKAKGLEFPIVIYPYANSELVRFKDKKIWLEVDKESFATFDQLMVSLKKEIEHYPEPWNLKFEAEKQKIELDAFNLLYVAFTRAVDALYILCESGFDSKGNVKSNTYPGLFTSFLKNEGKWVDGQWEYYFGTLPEYDKKVEESNQEVPLKFHYSYKDRPEFRPVTQSGILWDTQREAAIAKGNLVHHALGYIESVADLPRAIEQLEANGDAGMEDLTEVAELLNRIISHPELQEFYREGYEIRNETDIILENGVILRPDRICLDGNTCAIIEYKTGIPNPSHREQVNTYAGAMEEMGFKVTAKKLIYIGEELTIKTVA